MFDLLVFCMDNGRAAMAITRSSNCFCFFHTSASSSSSSSGQHQRGHEAHGQVPVPRAAVVYEGGLLVHVEEPPHRFELHARHPHLHH
jgi:hypothetical protein